MNDAKLYYTAPSNEQFNELKQAAIALWETYEHPNYVAEKVGRIKDIGNIQDNFMYMVAMFDSVNQAKLAAKLSPETRQAVRDRMIDGGQPEWEIPF